MAGLTPLADLPALDDPVVPAASLLGRDAGGLLAAAIGQAGGELRSAVARQASYQPGRSLTVRYDAAVRWAGGGVTNEMLVARVGRHLPAGALVLDDGDTQVAVWRVPHDPDLPGLAPALDPHRLRRLLADLGADVASATPRLRAYRPGRRGVVEVSAPGARLFLKVVRPAVVEGLHRRHVLLSDHVPVPASLGWSPELGLLALQALDGRTLRATLDQRRGLPGSAGLLAILDELPDAAGVTGPAMAWRAPHFAALVASVAPELGPRVRRLAEELQEAEAKASEPLVPVHGDLHEAQILVDGGRITGVLDVDTFGLGRRVDDLATMIGHLATLAIGSPRRQVIERYASELLDAFDRKVDPVLLRKATAAVVLGLATGPFRVLEPRWRAATSRRVGLAEQWLASAHRLTRRSVAS